LLSLGWWEVLVTLQFGASDTLFGDSRFTVGQWITSLSGLRLQW